MSVSLGGQTITELAGDPDQNLRTRFKIEIGTNQTLNTGQIIIANLSSATTQSLVQQALSRPILSLSAGYVGNSGTIFQGDCLYAIAGRESPTDTALQLWARDGGNGHDYGVISKSLQKGSTPMDHYNLFLQALQPFGISQGYVPTDKFSSPTYPRGVAFAGMVKDYLRTLASSTGCTWSIQQGQLQMMPNDGASLGGPFILNSSTGLIGMPTQTFGGIMIRCLINPAINLTNGNLVQVDQSLVQGTAPPINLGSEATESTIPNIATDGLYQVRHIDITGDTRGNDWYMDLACVANSNPGFIPQNLLYNAGN